VEKKKYITGHNIEPGDKIIALREYGLRSNGFSLARHICRQGNISYGDIFTGNQTWGEALLKPSVIYHDAVLQLIGRYGEPAKAQVSGIAHITGGGIAENLRRILKTRNTGARLDNLWNPPQVIQKLQELGSVTDEEAYKTWNMGNGMLIIIPEEEAESALNILNEAKNIEARVAGEVTKKTEIVLKMWR
jgi:phosphoribosylformylglycinamidine cyclo-ligase